MNIEISLGHERLPTNVTQPLFIVSVSSPSQTQNWQVGVTAEYPATSKQCLGNGGYAATRLNGRVATRLRSYAATWVRGYAATRLRGYAATRLRSYVGTWLRGYAATQLRSYVATQPRGYTATWLHGLVAMQLTIDEVLKFTYWWCQDLRQWQIKQQLGLGSHTAVDWDMFCREVCEVALFDGREKLAAQESWFR